MAIGERFTERIASTLERPIANATIISTAALVIALLALMLVIGKGARHGA